MPELIPNPQENNHPITISFIRHQYPKNPILSQIGSTNYQEC